MNPRQILNNYRLGRMPGSMYKRGGSKRMPGYGMGGSRRLPMAQTNLNMDGGMNDAEAQLQEEIQMTPDEQANAIRDYAMSLVAQGMYKDTRRGKKRAYEDALLAFGITQPAQKKHFLDYLNAVTNVLTPVANTYSTIKQAQNFQNMNQGSNDPFGRKYGGASRKLPKAQFNIQGNQPRTREEMLAMMRGAGNPGSAAVKKLIQGRDLEKKAILNMMGDIIQKTGMDQASAQQIMGVLSNMDAAEAMQYLNAINQDIEATRTEKRLLSPDMKRRGGAKRKAKYQSKGEFIPKPIPTYVGPKTQKGLGGTAQERVQQMKHGGSMCRGLPGGPNEFPM